MAAERAAFAGKTLNRKIILDSPKSAHGNAFTALFTKLLINKRGLPASKFMALFNLRVQ